MTRRTLATTFPPVTMTSPDGSTRTLTLNQTSPGGRDSKPVPPAAINDQGTLHLRVDANDGTIS